MREKKKREAMAEFEAATDEKMMVTIVALATFLRLTKEEVDERKTNDGEKDEMRLIHIEL